MDDPESYGELEVRFIQPYRATKDYICPNCNRDIAAGTGHYVVVPVEAPDLRRHWHRGCWEGRKTRGPRR
jgi:acetone carboxylase gamma subunit